jgi:hypothetical protein
VACTIVEQVPEAESVTLVVTGHPPVALSHRTATRVLVHPVAAAGRPASVRPKGSKPKV